MPEMKEAGARQRLPLLLHFALAIAAPQRWQHYGRVAILPQDQPKAAIQRQLHGAERGSDVFQRAGRDRPGATKKAGTTFSFPWS